MKSERDPIKLRHYLHTLAELSGNETRTAAALKSILNDLNPVHLSSDVGGTGIIAVFGFHPEGKRIMFRSDMDALPIDEPDEFPNHSTTKGVAHKCGHDGHMAIMLALAIYLSKKQDEMKGLVGLLFQPEEETGTGSAKVINDPAFAQFEPEMIFGLHNLPGFPLGSVILKKGIFALSSMGLILRLKGRTSHAGEPEKGLSPMEIFRELLGVLPGLAEFEDDKRAMLTIIHARLGEIAFGTSPGYAEIMATLRGENDETVANMNKKAIEIAQKLCKNKGLEFEHENLEIFPATVNHPGEIEMVRSAALNCGMEIIEPKTPFSWTEDFSNYLNKIPGAFFGLGAGEDHPKLHNPEYDFPDKIIKTGCKLYIEILKKSGVL